MSNVEFGSPSPKVSVETSYRGIGKSHMVLQKSAMKELRRYLSFTQLRFHCRKKEGRTFHVVTASNSSGEAVVRYFSGETDEQPEACGSFVRLTGDDNSKLAGICKDWGQLVSGESLVGKWGHGEDQKRLYRFPVLKKNKYHLRVQLHNVDVLQKMECDDNRNTVDTNGDFWRVFVR